MQVYDDLKANIRKIEQNSRGIKKLSERYNSSTGKDENQGTIRYHIFYMFAFSQINDVNDIYSYYEGVG